jgi:aminoglycoside phosphotransferase (APT) family kinase protein
MSLRVIEVAGLYAYDIVRRPQPRTLDEVPPSPKAATPEWLTLALCPDRDARVSHVRYEHVSSGTAVRGRLHLTYAGADVDGLPPTVFAKSTPGLLTRLQVGATGGAEAEIRFYTRIRPHLPVLAPQGYYGKSEKRSGRSLLLIEDLGAGSSVTFGDPRSVHIDRTRAEQMVETLANVHATLIGSERFAGDLRWVRSSLQVQTALNERVDFARRSQVGIDRAGEIIPATLLDQRGRVHELLMKSLTLDAERAPGLLHTDVHPGNWYVTDDGMGLFDWTAVAKGDGTRDLAYALASSLATEDRRAWERDLVTLYAERMAELSGVARDAAETWTSYRQQMLHGFYYWAYTLGGGRMQPKMQPNDLTRIIVQRTAQATVDLETLKALEP